MTREQAALVLVQVTTASALPVAAFSRCRVSLLVLRPQRAETDALTFWRGYRARPCKLPLRCMVWSTQTPHRCLVSCAVSGGSNAASAIRLCASFRVRVVTARVAECFQVNPLTNGMHCSSLHFHIQKLRNQLANVYNRALED